MPKKAKPSKTPKPLQRAAKPFDWRDYKIQRQLTYGEGHHRITTYYQPDGVTHINHHHATGHWTISDFFGEAPRRYRSYQEAHNAIHTDLHQAGNP